MRSEDEIRGRVQECLSVLKEFAGKPDFGGPDFIIADRNITTMSTLLWVLNEAPPDEAKKLADSVLKKFQAPK